MATYTPNLTLRKPSRMSGSDDIVDVTLDVNANMDILDQNINLRTCLSSSRPSSPTTGMTIIETDTLNLYVWSGSSWDYIGNNSSSRGKINLSTSTSAGTARSNGDPEVSYNPLTFSAVNGRRYWVEVHIYCTASAATGTGRFNINVRWAAGATVANSDTSLGNPQLDLPLVGSLNGQWYTGVFELTPGVTGNVTVAPFYTTNEAGDTVAVAGNAASPTRVNWISVRDVGV